MTNINEEAGASMDNESLLQTANVSNASTSISNSVIADSDTNTNRKKAKKRDRSPSNAVETALGSGNAQNTTLNASSVDSTDVITTNTTNAVVSQKKEKQRPETWNKIEQQIFFNALRQV